MTNSESSNFTFRKCDVSSLKPIQIPKRIRLGHKMEHVFKQLIEFRSDYEILLHNMPIREGKRTIGEIDFILREVHSQNIIHVELTYKFYIINPEISEPIHRLMGPNKRDMFFTKMEKIKNEQFQLLHAPQGIKSLKEVEIDHNKIKHQACFKAQLFAPYGATASNIRPLNRNCVCGHWIHFDDFNATEFTKFQFYIPTKSEWVIEPHTAVTWASHFETLMEVNLRMLKKNAPMIWLKKPDTELEKLFVVWW